MKLAKERQTLNLSQHSHDKFHRSFARNESEQKLVCREEIQGKKRSRERRTINRFEREDDSKSLNVYRAHALLAARNQSNAKWCRIIDQNVYTLFDVENLRNCTRLSIIILWNSMRFPAVMLHRIRYVDRTEIRSC